MKSFSSQSSPASRRTSLSPFHLFTFSPSFWRGKTVLVTGASSGIGAAVAKECARAGADALFLCGRDRPRLDAVADECRALGARLVRADVVDVRDAAATESWLRSCDADSPLDVVFANAGRGTGRETAENVRHTFALNVGGVVNTVLPAIEIFRAHAANHIANHEPRTTNHESRTTSHEPRSTNHEPRTTSHESRITNREPHVVVTASIAGYGPLAACPSYAATKACVKSWGLSLRGFLRKEGIRVSVVCPGFVRSRITDRNTCPMPFFMEADKAARIILSRVARNVGLISFPWPMRFGSWLLSILPWRVAETIVRALPEKNADNQV